MPLSRRDFLRIAGLAAAGAACGSGGSPAPTRREATEAGRKTLRIAQWSHFIPAYDEWFDNEFTRRWGEEHNVEVVVDHIPFPQLRGRAEAEIGAQRGHDIFSLIIPPAGLADEVIDHRDIIDEIQAEAGPISPLVDRTVRDEATGRYFAVPEYWVPNVLQYRTDLWAGGSPPDTWADVLEAGPALKAAGHPIGVGISRDHDSTITLLGLMFSHGASIQDAEGNVAINRRATVEAVKIGTEILRMSESDEILTWDAASDNRYLTSGKGSLILDPIAAIRTAEKQNPELAGRVALAPTLAGPRGRYGAIGVIGSYVVWRFSSQPELAHRFLVDLALATRDSFVRSEFYNLPAFPGAVPDLEDLLAAPGPPAPAGKYAVLADAAAWSTNIGHPRADSPAVEEVFAEFVIPDMFIAAARGELTADEAVAAAEARMVPIFDKWRERGRV